MRDPPISVFTTSEKLVVAMICKGYNYIETGHRLSLARETVKWHARNAANKIPGNLPVLTKILFWGRGATKDQLTGEGWIPGRSQ